VGWVPTLAGIGLRAVLYRLMLRVHGWAAIERNVRLRFANHIHLGHGTYLDEGVYIQACPNGDVWLGSGAIVTDGVVTEVVLPHTVVGGVPRRGRWAARSRAPGEVASSCCTAHGKSRSVCAALDGLQELPFQLQQDETKVIFNYRR